VFRITKGFSGQEVALFPNMLADPTPSALPSNSISSPASTHTQPSPQPSPPQPSPTQPSPTHLGSEYHSPTPHDSPLHAVHSHGSDEVLEDDLKKTNQTYSVVVTKLILRGRKLSDAEVQEKASTETKPFIQEVTPTEVIQDQRSSEKGSAEFSTAGASKGTGSKVPVVSTAEENISTAGGTVTYRRRSEE
ncbi:hypothetical protein Tco_0147641, partial [Tanacetum coccineum]